MSISAVLFDLDYTLAVPERSRSALLDAAVDEVGAPPLSRRAYLDAHERHLTAETRTPIFEDLLGDRDTDATPEALSDAYHRAILEALAPVDGAEALVRSLRDRYRVGLLTNGPEVAQREKIERLGWETLFDATVTTGSIDAGKPDERAFAALLDDLSVSASRAVYVGDDVDADVRGAKAAGLFAVQVVFPGGPDPDPAADAYVERADMRNSLPAVIESLCRRPR